MILNGFPGVQYGIPFPVLLRGMFGYSGAKIAAIVRGLVGA
jgi:NCS1 family nucleobase:cation symporter-1